MPWAPVWRFARFLSLSVPRRLSGAENALVLRPYQKSCLAACIEALHSGASRIGISLPTGAGKTSIFVVLMSQISPPPQFPNATRSLVIVNSIELARQAASQARALFPKWTVEIEQGVKHKASGIPLFRTIATYQTLLRPSRIAKFDPSFLKAIIVDEAHHAAAPSYRRVLSHFHPQVKHPDSTFEPPKIPHSVPIIGFSATFSRHDGLALGSVFERIVYHRDFLEMIKEQWLCNVKFTSVRADIDLKDVVLNSRTGDFNATSLAHVINTDTVNNLLVKTWLDRAASRKSTLVFCANLAHVRELTKEFREYGVDARYVYSRTRASERKALVDSFRLGQFPVLVNCAILTEGADIPNIDCIIIARPTRSRNLFSQMIGRGMRQSPQTSKVDCRIIDLVESLTHVDGVISVPTLFGLDPSEVIEDEDIQELEERAKASIVDSETENDIPDPESVTYVDYDNPFALVHQLSGAPHIAKMSRFAWVGCGGDVYVLECLGKGTIRIEPFHSDEDVEEKYKATYTPTVDIATAKALKISPFRRNRHILTAKTLGDAVRGCDTYARTKAVPGPLVSGLLRTARWRKLPATENQQAFIAKRRKAWTVPTDVSVNGTTWSLTKGEAANIITRLKHGAKARFDEKRRANERLMKERDKERVRRARETVRVGPLPPEKAELQSDPE